LRVAERKTPRSVATQSVNGGGLRLPRVRASEYRISRFRGTVRDVATADVIAAHEARSALAELFAAGRRREVRKGATLMLEGDIGSTVMLIVAGRVKVVQSAASGNDILLAVLGPGEHVGDFEALDPPPRYRTASVIALDAVALESVSMEDYATLLHTYPAAAIERLRVVTLRLRQSDRRRTEWISMSATARLAVVLADLVQTESHDTVEIDGLTQHDFGALIGASDDSVSRGLQELERRGLVTTARRQIMIGSRAQLERFTQHLSSDRASPAGRPARPSS
jgi:CRP/FNR family cyclic AMP-dependent transcriptional regulator